MGHSSETKRKRTDHNHFNYLYCSIHMLFFSSLLLFFIKLVLVCTSDDRSFNNSNCSLAFTVTTIYQSNKIQTDFPIELIASYNLTCHLSNLVAYYKITPLSILIFGQYKNPEENLKSMIELNSTTFRFNINQSSTIRLCVLSDDNDDDDDDDEYDNDYRICRQIHIGINKLYSFWNFPMKFFYLFVLSTVGCYYILFFLWDKWRQSGKKSKSSATRPVTSPGNAHDTFENEKVHEEETSDEE